LFLKISDKCVQEKLEDTKGVIRSYNWKKDRQYNDLKKKVKKTNNAQQNTRQKSEA